MAPQATPTPTPSQTPGEIEWEETVAAAKAEGKLVAATFTDPELEILLKQFEQTFGIEVEQVPGRPSRQAGQILTEQQAGQFNFDVLWHPVTNISITLKIKTFFIETISFKNVLNIYYKPRLTVSCTY